MKAIVNVFESKKKYLFSKKVSKYNTKAISPVVATALLLVVAVIAIVGFQNWYQSYSSNLFIISEEEGSVKNLENPIKIVSGETLYFNAQNQTIISSIKIGGVTCDNLNGSYSGVQRLNVSSCLENLTTSTPEVVIITQDSILSKNIFLPQNTNLNTQESSGLEFDFNVGSQCRYKDNKTNCLSYYGLDTIDNISVIHHSLLGLYWEQNSSVSAMDWPSAQTYCSSIGQGWRLPTMVELEVSLVDTSRATSPYIVGGQGASSLFNNIQNVYWSATAHSGTFSHTVRFDRGGSTMYDKSSNQYVLCVKEDQNYAEIWGSTQNYSYLGGVGQERVADEFIVDDVSCGGSGTLYDTITRLCWESNPSTADMTWPSAVNRCDTLSTAGGGWRLPEKAELMMLGFHGGFQATAPKLNSIGFTGFESTFYWSNTRYVLDPTQQVYAADYLYANAYYDFESFSGHNTLCVKSP